MDLITKSLLSAFAKEYEIEKMTESDQFERFAAFSMTRRHYSRSFELEDVSMGGGNDLGIDSLAIIVNNILVSDVDTVDEIAAQNGYLDVSFVFTQAKTSSKFESSQIGQFGFGVIDFFSTAPVLEKNDQIKAAVEIVNRIFSKAPLLRGRPICHLYYVTTGRWTEEADLAARRDAVRSDLSNTGIFSSVRFSCAGADELHSAYSQTKNATTRVFEFKNRNDLPVAEGIKQAFIGYVPFSQFRAIISDDSEDEILGSIFYDNVRDWQG